VHFLHEFEQGLPRIGLLHFRHGVHLRITSG
jgi:hypothetical protein